MLAQLRVTHPESLSHNAKQRFEDSRKIFLVIFEYSPGVQYNLLQAQTYCTVELPGS